MKHATNTFQLAKPAAFALFAMAAAYLTLFIIYGGILVMPEGLSLSEKIAFVVENKLLINWTYIIGYITFACLLVVVGYALDNICKPYFPNLSKYTAIFSYFWALLLLCAGMITISGNNMLADNNLVAESATSIYYATQLISDSLGGGIEFVGGVWIILLGYMSLKAKLFSNSFSIFSLIKGVVGIATLFSTEVMLRVFFGLSGIVWFIWFGIALLRYHNAAQTA